MSQKGIRWLVVILSFLTFNASGGTGSQVQKGVTGGQAGAAGDSDCPIQVKTTKGPVCGSLENGARVFRGIPYAKPPVKDLRWQDPQAMESWTTPTPNKFGNECPQNKKVNGIHVVEGDEDCLYLNVWAPPAAKAGSDYRVMVFVHGGGFIEGSGSGRFFDGTYYAAKKDTVMVTFNYRLGALGFLVLDEERIAGNYGFRDQLFALTWVKENISKFGGDPSNITLFGESAGAMSVGLHMMSTGTAAAELPFRAAAMESNPLGVPYKKHDDAEKLGICFKQKASPNAPLRNVDVKTLLEAQRTFTLLSLKEALRDLQNLLLWTPVFPDAGDGLFPGPQPINGAIPLPSILGTNHDEGYLFIDEEEKIFPITACLYNKALQLIFGDKYQVVHDKFPPHNFEFKKNAVKLSEIFGAYLFTCANRHLAASSAKSGVAPYVYQFNHVPEINMYPTDKDCAKKVCHGAELPFVFHSPVGLKDSEMQLSADIVVYWRNLAGTDHDPNPGRVPWHAFTPTPFYLYLAERITHGSAPEFSGILGVGCDWWEDNVGYDVTFPDLSSSVEGESYCSIF